MSEWPISNIPISRGSESLFEAREALKRPHWPAKGFGEDGRARSQSSAVGGGGSAVARCSTSLKPRGETAFCSVRVISSLNRNLFIFFFRNKFVYFVSISDLLSRQMPC